MNTMTGYSIPEKEFEMNDDWNINLMMLQQEQIWAIIIRNKQFILNFIISITKTKSNVISN